MKSKLLAVLEILFVYVVIHALGVALRSEGIMQWEIQNLGWTYTGSLAFIGVPAFVIWLMGRSWVEYGVSFINWPTNLDIGVKAYLVRFIPLLFGLGGAALLNLDYKKLNGGILVAIMEFIAIVVMVWVLNRQKPVKLMLGNLITILLLLLFPLVVGVVVKKLSIVIVSTVIWQFVFSGFGEEFVWRGYVLSRLNQSFGRPWQLYGIQFGAGLIISSLLFGLLHAFNTYNSAFGFASLSWGWAIFTTFSGLMFGIIREKTGSLVAPGIAHGLPDAVGESLVKMFSWM